MVGCGPGAEAPNPPSQSGAGIVEKLTVEELASRADSILVGEVTDIACYEEGEGNIYTLVTLRVEQTIKGETEEVVNVRVPGGELNGQAMWVEDAPSFQMGEGVVVFLEEREGIFTVVGGFQGKFTIDNNNMVGGNMPLSEFIEQLRDILASQ
jgi:hypothetical protein